MTSAVTIQPVGFHVGISGEWLVAAVSANVGDFLPRSAKALLGRPITAMFTEAAIHDIRNRMALLRSSETTEYLFQYPLAGQHKLFDLALYREGEGFGLDAVPCDDHGLGNAIGVLEGMLDRAAPTNDVVHLCQQAATQIRALTGFEQVAMQAGGKALAHSARSGIELVDPLLFVAIENELVVVDSKADPVRVLTVGTRPATTPRTTLRFPTDSELHALAAACAGAALVFPLVRDGQAWGQIGCYHRSRRHVSAERRNIARLFAQIISWRIEIAGLRRGS